MSKKEIKGTTGDQTSENRTELQDLGEFGLIDRLTKGITLFQESSVLGVGDDAAVISNDRKSTLVAKDLLLEGIHFDLSYAPLQHLGYKAVTVNISDIVAMNGHCHQVLVAIGLSNRFSLEAVETLYEGIHFACKQYGVDLVGGDTTSSQSGLVISVTAVGSADPDRVVTRSGAQNNDLICVTGNLGAAYMGLQVLAREKQVFLEDTEMQPQLEGYEYLVKRQLTAEARIDLVQWFEEQDLLPTAMIDLSDGLASDLMHICKASNQGARIYRDKLPIDPATTDAALEFNLDPATCALNGGEDYEILFTAGQDHFPKIESHPDISIIGHITDAGQGADLVLPDGTFTPLKAQGWNHFQGSSG